jgi:hypothetical protein
MIEQGHSAEAAALINAQLADHVTLEQQWNAPELLRIKAQATLHLSQPPTSASAVLLQALDLARSQQAKIWESRLTP